MSLTGLRPPQNARGDLPLDEVQALLIEAAETIEFLRSPLEPLEDVGLADLPPKGSA
jgi:hypothetical protein